MTAPADSLLGKLVLRAYDLVRLQDSTLLITADLGYSLHAVVTGKDKGGRSAYGFIAKAASGRWLYAVHGTSDLWQLGKDAQAFFMVAPRQMPGRVHYGGGDIYRSMLVDGTNQHPADYIKALGGDWDLAGHSLGGSLVSWVGVELGLPSVTFGEPRFQDDEFATSALPRVLGKRRYVNSLDVIPDVPLRAEPLEPWQHYGDKVKLVGGGANPLNFEEHHAMTTYLSLIPDATS